MSETKLYNPDKARKPKIPEVSEQPMEHSKEVITHYASKLRDGQMGALIKVLFSDPATRERILSLHADKDIFNTPDIDYSKSPQKISDLLVTLMRDKELRPLVVHAINQSLNTESEAHKADIAESDKNFLKKGEATGEDLRHLAYDEGIIGAGVNAAIYNSARTRANPDIKSMGFERSDDVTQNFRTKPFIYINSPTSKHSPVTPSYQLGTGDQNTFGKEAPVQLSYLETARFPQGPTLADVAIGNEFLSKTSHLMETQVKRILRPADKPKSDKTNWPAKYKVLLQDGTFVFLDRVIIGSGPGEMEYPKEFDPDTLNICEQYRSGIENLDNDTPCPVMNYDELGIFMKNSQHPFRPFANKTIDIVGVGHSGLTAEEFFARLSPPEAYKDDVAQVGDIAKIHAVGLKSKTDQEYAKDLKFHRYGMLGVEMPPAEEIKGMRERKIEPINGKLVKIKESEHPEKGRFSALYQMSDGSILERYTDFIVLSNGYKNKIGEFLGEKDNPFDDHDKAEVVKGMFPDINAILPIAVKIKDEDIYAIGPASISQVLVDAELQTSAATSGATSKRNYSPAIANFGARTEKLAEILAEDQGPSHFPEDPFREEKIELVFAKGGAQANIVEPLTPAYSDRDTIKLPEIKMKYAFAVALRNFRVPKFETSSRLAIHFEKKKKTDQTFEIYFDPPLDAASQEAMRQSFAAEGILTLVSRTIGRGRWNSLSANITFSSGGNVDMRAIQIISETKPGGTR